MPLSRFTGPENANILVLTELPETVDEVSDRPHVGPEGRLLKNLMNNAWMQHGSTSADIMLGYCMVHKPTHGISSLADLYEKPKSHYGPMPEILQAHKSLREMIDKYQPNIIVAAGPEVFHFLTGQENFDTLRGYVLDVEGLASDRYVKVIGIYHPKRMMFEDYLRFVAVMDLRKALGEADTKTLSFPEKFVETNATYDTFMDYLHWLTDGYHDKPGDFPFVEELESGIAVDLENIIGYNNHITQIGIGHSTKFAMTFNPGASNFQALTAQQEAAMYLALHRLSKTKHDFIFHNGSHDISLMLKHYGVLFRDDFDTMLAGQLLWPEFRKSLAFLSSLCLNVPAWKHQSGEDIYNAYDVINTKALADTFRELLPQRGLSEIFATEISEIPLAVMLQLQGVPVDEKVRKQMFEDFSAKRDRLEKELEIEIEKATGVKQKVNYGSPKQLQKLLYEDLKLPPMYKRRKSATEARKMTTDSEALVKLCRKTKSPVPQLLIDIKKTKKALSSYLTFDVSPNGCVHTSYNIGSSTERFVSKGSEDSRSLGRWSSSSSILMPYGPGNLQSIPYYARKMFVPFDQENEEMGSADYVQAEAVIVAYLSNDEPLIEAIEKGVKLRQEWRELCFKRESTAAPALAEIDTEIERIKLELKHVDMHRIKANEVMGIPILSVSSEQRQVGKVLRHATNYKSGPAVPQAMAASQGIHEEIAYWKDLMRRDEAASPYKSMWHKHVEERLHTENRTLTNCFGRVRRFLTGSDPNKFKDLVGRALAFEPQSTIGDLLNVSLVDFYDQWADVVRILLQLHDGTYITYPKGERHIWLPRLRQAMEREITLTNIYGDKKTITVDVEMSAGPSWGELEDVPY